MTKKDEISDPTSCLNKAKDNELVFVLLGRDEAAPKAIRHWVKKRIALGLNRYDDPQLLEALEVARNMEAEEGA